MQPEVTVGVWRRSVWTGGFWWRTLVTLTLYYWLLWRRNSITLTSRRVTERRGGIIGGEEVSISIDNITDVTVNQSPLAVILNYGTISIQSAGSGAAEIAFSGLGGAMALKNAIYDVKDGKFDQK